MESKNEAHIEQGVLENVDDVLLKNRDGDMYTSSKQGDLVTLGARGVLPCRQIERFLRDFKQFTPTLPSR
jgi:hypothetical protein